MKYHSLSYRFGKSILISVGAILLIFSVGIITYNNKRLDADFERRLKYISDIAMVSLPSAVWNLDTETIDELAEALMLEEDLVFLNVFSGTRILATKVHPDYVSDIHLFFDNDGDFKVWETKIIFEGKKIGKVQSVMSTHRIREQLIVNSAVVLVLALFIFTVIVFASMRTTRKFIFHPFSALESSAAQIAEGNLEASVDVSNEDEIGNLARSLDTMRRSIQDLVSDLRGANNKLEDYNQTLERRVAERTKELQELNELKNKFMGMAAHDLRNPIGAIRGMSQLIMDLDLEAEKEKDFIQSINTVSDQMLDLLNDLLDVSAIESGNFELDWESGDISELLRSRVELVGLNAKEKGVDITVQAENAPMFEFDHARIIQVIDNLLTNAVKFSPPDSTIETAVRADETTMMVVVRDHGQGIPPDEIDKLFSPFEKLSSKPTAGEKSTGLGLAIVKRIVDAHGGEITVRNAPEGGAEFTLSLPIDVNK